MFLGPFGRPVRRAGLRLPLGLRLGLGVWHAPLSLCRNARTAQRDDEERRGKESEMHGTALLSSVTAIGVPCLSRSAKRRNSAQSPRIGNVPGAAGR